MGKIVDYNVTGELEHGVYVSCLVRDLARELYLDEPMVYELTLAGLLHDIGKLRLTGYLNGERGAEKPLLIEEMKFVRMHSSLSDDILKEKGFSPIVLESVRYHHENYDGTGYPGNLSGEDIPLGARIVRVCDVFAALTTDRPYRQRFTTEEALSLMIDEISHFDLKIFLAFQRVIHRVGTEYQISFPKDDELLLQMFREETADDLDLVHEHLEDGIILSR